MDAFAFPAPEPLDDIGLDLIFREGRTFNAFLDKPVEEATLRRLAELAELGPTEANSLPGRFVFVTSPAAKARLIPLLSEGNREKSQKAPVNVIIAYDMEFYEQLPKTFPHADARSWYVGRDEAGKRASATRSAALQGAYLLLAARALGLDTGPLGGFDGPAIDAEFLSGTAWKTLFVMNLGYGDRSKLLPRLPRLPFADFARVE